MWVGIIILVLLLIGTPIGVALGMGGLVGMAMLGGETMMQVAPSKIFNGLNIFPFLAMPFFILAGEIMNHTGITWRLIQLAQALVGHFRGGLAHTNMLASVLFSGLSGAATADAAAFGRTLVPAMEKEGYTRAYACAVTAAGSIIGPTIPPSGLMVVYGSLMGVSIGGLFATGILPGLLICLMGMAIIAAFGKRKDLPKRGQKASLMEIFHAFRHSLLALFMPLIILGGILGGRFTPTEASAIAVAYALFIGSVVYRALTWQDLFRMLISTARISAVVFLIIATAAILGWWLSFMQIPQQIASYIISLSSDPKWVLLMIIATLLVIGMLMDINAMLILLAPLLVPLTVQIGMDPLHAGIVFILALNISLMSPPVGACLFVLSSVTGEKMERITMELWPFLIGEIIVLLIVAYSPSLVLFLPRLLTF